MSIGIKENELSKSFYDCPQKKLALLMAVQRLAVAVIDTTKWHLEKVEQLHDRMLFVFDCAECSPLLLQCTIFHKDINTAIWGDIRK